MTTSAELRARWLTDDGQVLAAEVLVRLHAGRSLDGLPLDRVGGRVDLRGLSARVRSDATATVGEREVRRAVGFLDVHEVTISDLDLSFAVLPSARFDRARLTNCSFQTAVLSKWRLWASDVTSCSFAGADLRESVIGSWSNGRGNRWEQVSFTRADLRGTVQDSAIFVDVDFSSTRLDRVEFRSCDFVRCRFAGVLREVIFYGPGFGHGDLLVRLEDVDFSEAMFRWVDFRRLDPSPVALPRTDGHLVIRNFPCVLATALSDTASDDRRGIRGLKGLLTNDVKWLAPGQTLGVISLSDIAEAAEDERDAAVSIIHRAIEKCAVN